jgi:hypothetical protein
MATAVLFIGLGHPHNVTEPEKAYMWLAAEGNQFLEKQKGKFIEKVEHVALTAHGGDLAGLVLLYGDRAKLDELRRTDEFEAFVMNLGRRFSKLAVVPGLNWEGIQGVMKRMKS